MAYNLPPRSLLTYMIRPSVKYRMIWKFWVECVDPWSGTPLLFTLNICLFLFKPCRICTPDNKELILLSIICCRCLLDWIIYSTNKQGHQQSVAVSYTATTAWMLLTSLGMRCCGMACHPTTSICQSKPMWFCSSFWHKKHAKDDPSSVQCVWDQDLIQVLPSCPLTHFCRSLL